MLNDIITTDIFRFLIVFTRMGAAAMFMPGIGGSRVPPRVKLLFALALSFLLLPVVGREISAQPRHVGGLVLLIASEATIGVFLAMIMQAVMAALNVAGSFISFQTGLTNAFSFDSVAEQQSAAITTFFANLALVVLFATDLHHLMIRAVADSYATFKPGAPLPLGEFSDVLAHTLSASFAFGIKLAAPLFAFGLIFYAGLGLLSRMVPQMQVFFVAMPLQVMGGLWMLMVALPIMVFLFLRQFSDALVPFLAGR